MKTYDRGLALWSRMPTLRLVLAAAVLMIAAPLRAQSACGVDRWPVKILADRDRAAVRLDQVVSTTVSALGALPIPEIPYPNDRRISPHELTVYKVTAIVWQIRMDEGDGDWHVILRDPQDGSLMIAEIPSPECTRDTALAAKYTAAREVLRQVPKRGTATFTGVGFWDFIHNQRGRARNGFELHPVLGVEQR